MNSLLWLLLSLLELYFWCVIISVVMSWLIHFQVVNTSNRFVYMVYDMMYRITEPALRPIRRIVPNLGGIDISPVIVILLIVFSQRLLIEYWPR